MLFVHVDDLLIAHKLGDKSLEEHFSRLETMFHLDRRDGDIWEYCGKQIEVTPGSYRVSCPKCIKALEDIQLSRDRLRTPLSPLTPQELHAYRSLLGTLNFAVTWVRGDLQVDASVAAQRTTKAQVRDAIMLNKVAQRARDTSDFAIVVPRGKVDLEKAVLMSWGDAAFANAEDKDNYPKSMHGLCLGLAEVSSTEGPIQKADFSRMVPLGFKGGTIKRVVRSTLAAEAYGISEALETAQFARYVLLEALLPPSSARGQDCRSPGPAGARGDGGTGPGAGSARTLAERIRANSAGVLGAAAAQARRRLGPTLSEVESHHTSLPLMVLTDSENLTQAVRKDAGQIQDKRLRIVIAMLRQTCEIEPSVTVRWVPTHLMVADALTKLGLDVTLIKAFLGSRLCVPTPKPKPKLKKPATTIDESNMVMTSQGAPTALGGSRLDVSTPRRAVPAPRVHLRKDRSSGVHTVPHQSCQSSFAGRARSVSFSAQNNRRSGCLREHIPVAPAASCIVPRRPRMALVLGMLAGSRTVRASGPLQVWTERSGGPGGAGSAAEYTAIPENGFQLQLPFLGHLLGLPVDDLGGYELFVPWWALVAFVAALFAGWLAAGVACCWLRDARIARLRFLCSCCALALADRHRQCLI